MRFFLPHLFLEALLVAGSDASPGHASQTVASVAQRQLSASSNHTSFANSSTPLVKTINPLLSIAIAIGTVSTYFFLIRNSDALSQGFILPRSSIERRLQRLLFSFWLDRLAGNEAIDPIHNDANEVLWITERDFDPSLWLLLFSKYSIKRDSASTESGSSNAELNVSNTDLFFIAGHQDLFPTREERSRPCMETNHVWFYPATPVMKNITQMFIWEFWGIWMTMVMVVLTITYNGFIYHAPGPDGWFRLGLVSVYAVLNLFHTYQSFLYSRQILNFVGEQACWSLISKLWLFTKPLECWIESYAERHHNLLGLHRQAELVQFNCELFGQVKATKVYEPISRNNLEEGEINRAKKAMKRQGMYMDSAADGFCIKEKDAISQFKAAEESIKPFIDTELKTFEKAAESGLERVIANVAVLMGICLSTGLAPLTTVRSGDSTAVQIGSYALLLALGTGAAALVASLSQLNSAADSAKALLGFQLHILSIPAHRPESRLSEANARKSYEMMMPAHEDGVLVSWKDLFRSIRFQRRALIPFLGPALGLLPSPSEYDEKIVRIAITDCVLAAFFDLRTWITEGEGRQPDAEDHTG